MKFLIAIVLVPFVAQIQAFPRPSKVIGTRIIGGTDAPLGSVPHQVSLLSGGVNGRHICGGSIISEDYIITSTQCAYAALASLSESRLDQTSSQAVSGSPSNSQTVDVDKVVVHPEYDSSSFSNDIAIMRLAKKLTLSPSVRTAAIELPEAGYEDTGDVTATGWGTTSESSATPSNTLKTVTVPVISDDACTDAYGIGETFDSMICAGDSAGGKDTCLGDSGGPLVEEKSGALVGIVSWGYGCGRSRIPRSLHRSLIFP